MLVLRLRHIGLTEFNRAKEAIAEGRLCVEQAAIFLSSGNLTASAGRPHLIETVTNLEKRAHAHGTRDWRVKDKIHLLKDRVRDTIMETCCGLHNFRLQFRPWNYGY